MKKTVLLITALLAIGAATAQDTLVSAYPKSTYFYDAWIDSGGMTLTNFPVDILGYLTAKYCDAGQDTLQVYGIAASLGVFTQGVIDMNNHKEVYDYLCLYKRVADTLQAVSDSLLVHLFDTPVSYYFLLNQPLAYPNPPNRPFPFYERYFDTPMAMTDSFYVGLTHRSMDPEMQTSGPDSGLYSQQLSHMGVLINAYAWPGQFPSAKVMMAGYWMPDTMAGIYDYPLRWKFYDLTNPMQSLPGLGYPLIFPILTPPDTTPSNPIDTTHVDTTHIDTTHVDTVGIDVRLVERYTGLQPNPAAERVQVLSSFGLQHIEVFNAAGTKVQEQKATGYSATLDIRALPAGPYLVRIATPSGTVTKKLLVQRR